MARAPVLAPNYSDRNLELWMLERGALYAKTNGFRSIEVPAAALKPMIRDFEERRWWLEGDVFRRSFADDPEVE